MPWNYAFTVMAMVETPYSLVITDNPCGEYCDDLFNLGVTVLISRQLELTELTYLLKQAVQGKRQHIGYFYKSPLTRRERRVLRQGALSSSIADVSTTLKMSEGSVRNCLSSIYGKVGLNSFSDLPLYYLGGIVQNKE